jgi:adenylate/nucleoside-diphosphate kinase
MFDCSSSYMCCVAFIFRSPHLYSNLKLPHKLPPKRDPLVVSSLPMLGYMEQTVAHAITKALTAVGTVKPKHPFVNSTKSALIYVAYYLKGKYSVTDGDTE